MSFIASAFGAPGLSFAASILALVLGCFLPGSTKSAPGGDGVRAALVAAERLLLSVSVALVLAVLVEQASRFDPLLGRLVTLPGIVLAAVFAGLCVGRMWRGVRFLQASLVLGFAMSAVFVFVQTRSSGHGAGDWRTEAAVAVGAALAILVMHVVAIFDARRRTA